LRVKDSAKGYLIKMTLIHGVMGPVMIVEGKRVKGGI
jgi:hypothetical protein